MNRTRLSTLMALLTYLLGAGCNPSGGADGEDAASALLGITGSMDPAGAQTDGAGSTQPQTGKSSTLVLHAITPAKGSLDGGTVVSLQGPGLTAGATVTFGGVPATHVQLINEGLLAATTPAHAEGAVDIAVTNDLGDVQQVEDGYVYSAAISARPPQIGVTSLVPAAGSPEGGAYVTIRGTGFESGMAVLFDGLAALSVTVVNDRLITVMTPGHAEGQVNVMIETPKGASFLLVNGFEYTSGLPANDGTDTDGDGLTDYQEVAGWEIWIDPFGLGLGVDTFGNVTRYVVNSDPQQVDTDGDGLDDFTEYLVGSDPQLVDTDGDGLSDGDERLRWKTNPITVDTDADSRGPDGRLAPSDLLFDGQELYTVAELAKPANQRTLKPRATSPTLADTDGDGISDFDEVVSTVRSPVIADLPQVRFEIVDQVDVRLHVEYADSVGAEETYGAELSSSTAQSSSATDITSSTESWNIGGEVGWEGEGPVVKVSGGYGEESTTGTELTTETAKECAAALSQSQTQSSERSVTRSSGSIALGLRAVNTGNIVYTLNDLNITVRQFKPREGTYRALTSLVPPQGADSFVLSPGDSTPVIPLSDNALDADPVIQFLANPSALLLEPTSFGLLNKDGTNFAFQTQDTLGQTALVVIDYGQGIVEKHRVATNVNRNPDSSLVGIALGQALTELGLDYATEVNDDGGPANGHRRISRIGVYSESAFGSVAPTLNDPPYPAGKGPGPRNLRRFWVPMYARGNPTLPPIDPNAIDVDRFALHAQDEVRLVYLRDEDRDGLYDRQEAALGSADTRVDSDNDGLSDWYEARVGWTVTIQGQSPPPAYQVFPKPLLADADGDGLNDKQEQQLGTDPNSADTDDDTLADNLDTFPLVRARTLYVNASVVGGTKDGSSWANASDSLSGALTIAAQANSDANPSNNVRQIWVAQGNYFAPAATGMVLVSNVSVFGGFRGTETLRAQRNPDPFTNETHIKADPGPVGFTLSAVGVSNVQLDGFIVEDGHGVAIPGLLAASATNLALTNLLFQNHHSTIAQSSSSGVAVAAASTVVLQNCTFSNNTCDAGPGAFRIYNNSTVQFSGCSFLANTGTVLASSATGGGGALHAEDSPSVTFENCTFRMNQLVCPSTSINQNTALRHGGAVQLQRIAQSRMLNCLFQDNQLTITGTTDTAEADNRGGGALSIEETGTYTLVDCVFFRNQAPKVGGGLYIGIGAGKQGPRVRAVNCTFSRNQATAYGSNYAAGAGVFADYPVFGRHELLNCVMWGNLATTTDSTIKNNEVEQVGHFPGLLTGNNCCIQNLGVGSPGVSGLGNIGQDPRFINQTGGDLRLSAGSPCIDAGNTLVDTDLSHSGTQPLPPQDFQGNARVADGDGNGVADVDIGAYEFQGN